ncbi:MAG: hypothetical protein K2H87_02245 [Duncaniella sp.]|nr:hypothetical protein [Duncaniella sp.]
MRKNIKWLVAVLATLLAVVATSCSSSGDAPNGLNGSLKFSRLNLNRVKALGLAASSRAGDLVDPGLLKVDDDGNVSTIGMISEVVNEETGETITKEVAITVRPRNIADLELYTLLLWCDFVDADGYCYLVRPFYEPEAPVGSVSLMIRKSDGKVLYVPTGVGDDVDNQLVDIYRDINSYGKDNYKLTFVSPDGEVYITTYGGTFYKLEESGDRINLKVVADGFDSGAGFDGVTFANDGSIMVTSAHAGYDRYDECTIIKPNGEIFRHKTTNDEDIIGYSGTAGHYIATRTRSKDIGDNVRDIEFTIHKVNADFSLGDEIFKINTQYDSDSDFSLGHWLYAFMHGSAPRVYESDNYYIVGNFLAVNKRTGEYRAYEGTDWDTNVIVFPREDKSFTYNGYEWSIGFEKAWYFDPNTLEGGVVNFKRVYADETNTPGAYYPWPRINNIKQGEVTFYKEENGKTTFYKVDLNTGNETITESDYRIDTLVPVK